jgi:hypothetical protein
MFLSDCCLNSFSIAQQISFLKPLNSNNMKFFTILFLIVSIYCLACSSTKKLMDSWVGDTKQNLILKWGPPERTATDGGTGEILVYSKQKYNAITEATMYFIYMFYANSDDKIYHWRTESGTVPPQNINMRLYIR